MSRNYEILRQEEQHERLFSTAAKQARLVDSKRRRNGLSNRAHEEVTKLVQSVFLSPGSQVPRVVVFSAVESGNGCSWVCARAGLILAAETEGRVCLVDGNVRRPGLRRELGLGQESNGHSISTAVPFGQLLEQLNGGNLSLLPCGPLCSDAHALLSSDRLQARILELKSEFGYVLIDAPPINLYADASVLGRMADGVVLVVEANATRREQARKAKEILEAGSVRLLGAVLNKRAFPIPNALYSKL
jgi:capsular exopolysaccharide synthesis family protein